MGDQSEAENSERIAEIEKATSEAIAKVETEREARLKAADEAVDREIVALATRSDEVKAAIAEIGEKRAPRKTGLDDNFLLARRGEQLPKDSIKQLDKEVTRRTKELEASRDQRRTQAETALATDIEKARLAALVEMEPIRRKINEEREAARADFLRRIEEIEDLKDPIRDDQCTILAEANLREIQDRYPGLIRGGMGAEAVLEILDRVELDPLARQLRGEIQNFTSASAARRRPSGCASSRRCARAATTRSGWCSRVLPVLPPDLRPMVQLDGGRFATSDLNDLYRRVINRNNRLKRLLELGAPEIIIRNEKRMLQEAVDSLIDNGRRGRAVAGRRQPQAEEPVATCSRASRGASARTCSASASTTPAAPSSSSARS